VDKGIGCVVQDILSTLISTSLLEWESFLKMDIKQKGKQFVQCKSG
jgi:hypothetical protein